MTTREERIIQGLQAQTETADILWERATASDGSQSLHAILPHLALPGGLRIKLTRTKWDREPGQYYSVAICTDQHSVEINTYAGNDILEELWRTAGRYATPVFPIDPLMACEGALGFYKESGNHATLDEAKADLEEQLRAAKGIGLGAVTE